VNAVEPTSTTGSTSHHPTITQTLCDGYSYPVSRIFDRAVSRTAYRIQDASARFPGVAMLWFTVNGSGGHGDMCMVTATEPEPGEEK
jgi:hypothetical protein